MTGVLKHDIFYAEMKDNNRRGFTLLEIMIVVVMIGMLAAIAIPAYMRAKSSVLNARFISDLRVASMSFEQYAFASGGFPAEAPPGVVPNGMVDYLVKMDWTGVTPIGGQWDWDAAEPGVAVINPAVSVEQMKEIDAKIDDGILASGEFRNNSAGSGYVYLVGN